MGRGGERSTVFDQHDSSMSPATLKVSHLEVINDLLSSNADVVIEDKLNHKLARMSALLSKCKNDEVNKQDTLPWESQGEPPEWPHGEGPTCEE